MVTDLERIELALHRTASRVTKEQYPPDVITFLRVFTEEVTRQNNNAYQLTKPKVVE